MNSCRYREVEHTADWALHITASDANELFRCAAQGMLSLLGARPAGSPSTTEQIELAGEDLESLLVTWLEEILFMVEARDVACSSIQVSISADCMLDAIVELAPREPVYKQIKAVTYHNLEIVNVENQLETTIVFDV